MYQFNSWDFIKHSECFQSWWKQIHQDMDYHIGLEWRDQDTWEYPQTHTTEPDSEKQPSHATNQARDQTARPGCTYLNWRPLPRKQSTGDCCLDQRDRYGITQREGQTQSLPHTPLGVIRPHTVLYLAHVVGVLRQIALIITWQCFHLTRVVRSNVVKFHTTLKQLSMRWVERSFHCWHWSNASIILKSLIFTR